MQYVQTFRPAVLAN